MDKQLMMVFRAKNVRGNAFDRVYKNLADGKYAQAGAAAYMGEIFPAYAKATAAATDAKDAKITAYEKVVASPTDEGAAMDAAVAYEEEKVTAKAQESVGVDTRNAIARIEKFAVELAKARREKDTAKRDALLKEFRKSLH